MQGEDRQLEQLQEAFDQTMLAFVQHWRCEADAVRVAVEQMQDTLATRGQQHHGSKELAERIVRVMGELEGLVQAYQQLVLHDGKVG